MSRYADKVLQLIAIKIKHSQVEEESIVPDSIMYQEDAYIVLESDKEEEFMTAAELSEKLQTFLRSPDIELPRELAKIETTEAQARHLLDNYFELDIGEGKYLQWYVVRLEK